MSRLANDQMTEELGFGKIISSNIFMRTLTKAKSKRLAKTVQNQAKAEDISFLLLFTILVETFTLSRYFNKLANSSDYIVAVKVQIIFFSVYC